MHNWNKTFVQLSQLTQLMRIHTGKHPYSMCSCSICYNRLQEKGNLIMHSTVRSGKRPFVWEIFEKDCAHQYHLTRHIEMHAGERYSCSGCCKTFCKSPSLKSILVITAPKALIVSYWLCCKLRL